MIEQIHDRIAADRGPVTRFDGSYDFLSNFYAWSVEIRLDPDGPPVGVDSVEHAYQACKTLAPSDRRHVAFAKTPGEAKRRGREVALRPGWNGMRLEIMRKLLAQKFRAGEWPARMLALTGERELVEGNHWGDTYWGVCRGVGFNHLGELLMERREALRDG